MVASVASSGSMPESDISENSSMDSRSWPERENPASIVFQVTIFLASIFHEAKLDVKLHELGGDGGVGLQPGDERRRMNGGAGAD